MRGRVASLNAAVAGSVALYAADRQRARRAGLKVAGYYSPLADRPVLAMNALYTCLRRSPIPVGIAGTHNSSGPLNAENYYRPFTLPKPFHLTYLKVTVDFSWPPDPGEVVTAFSTSGVKDGETALWP